MMILRTELEKNKFKVKFYSKDIEKFYEIKDIVKSCKGSWYYPSFRYWTVDANKSNFDILKYNGFSFSDEILRMFNGKDDKIKKVELSKTDISLLSGLRKYQLEGVRFIKQNKKGLIGDEMGLGKTIQAIGYIKINYDLKKILVITPASLKINWMREIQKWIHSDDICIINGKKLFKLSNNYRFYIINYDIIDAWKEKLLSVNFDIIIADEIQFISNHKAIRTKAFINICKKVSSQKVFLSGTPIKNRPKEFFTALNILAPEIFSSRWRYLQRYCNPKYNGFGWVFNGATNIEELREKISKIMIRRLKKDVLKELPAKIKTIISLSCDSISYEKYKKASEEFKDKEWVKNFDGKKSLETKQHFEYLKQLAYIAKRNYAINWIKEFLDTDNKLVVFGIHVKALEDLYETFKGEAVLFYGKSTMEERQMSVDLFQNDNAKKLFIGNLKAAGTGITLTAASHVAFLEFGWNPADHVQAEDRVHRIGQEDAVNVYYLVADGTIENKIVNMIQEKSRVLSNILDGKERSFFEEDSVLKNLIGDYANER